MYMHGQDILLFLFLSSEYTSAPTDSLVYLISAAKCYAQSLSKYLQFSVDVFLRLIMSFFKIC